jgi:hypothetical protein
MTGTGSHDERDGWVVQVHIDAVDANQARQRARQLTDALAGEPWIAARHTTVSRTTNEPQIGMLLADEQARLALARHDVAAVYRILQRHGVSQRRIAHLTGQSQSEVSEILKGRQVRAYGVLVRICDGLTIPRGQMGLAYDDETLDLLAADGQSLGASADRH